MKNKERDIVCLTGLFPEEYVDEKRTVYAIPVSEAVGKGACTKCSK